MCERICAASKEAQGSVDSLEKELEGLKDDMGDLKKVRCTPVKYHWSTSLGRPQTWKAPSCFQLAADISCIRTSTDKHRHSLCHDISAFSKLSRACLHAASSAAGESLWQQYMAAQECTRLQGLLSMLSRREAANVTYFAANAAWPAAAEGRLVDLQVLYGKLGDSINLD